MFQVTHFRSEFIRQSQATILRKVTLTQFLLMIVLTGLGVGLLGAPFWLAPLFIVAGYVAGYRWQGELLAKRGLAYGSVQVRQLMGKPRIVNIQAEWERERRKKARRKREERRRKK